MRKHRLQYICATCIFLATKVEETPRKLLEQIYVFDRLMKLRTNQEFTICSMSRATRWKNHIQSIELIILKELGYELYVDHPHKFVLHMINVLSVKDISSEEAEVWKELAQRAWNFCNDW